MNKESPTKILFVCMGNICRSPTAEGVFRHHATEAGIIERLSIDSAGTHAYHTGDPPDQRAVKAAERRGMSMQGMRARRVAADDFETFDLILAMDRDNASRLKEEAPPEHHEKIRLFLEYRAGDEIDVPDPYYGGAAGFERVLDLVEEASRGLLRTLSRTAVPSS